MLLVKICYPSYNMIINAFLICIRYWRRYQVIKMLPKYYCGLLKSGPDLM